MSKRSSKPSIPNRPQLIPEQLRAALAQQIGTGPRVLDREQSLQFVVMLAANLANLLNNRRQLPWITASIDKRSDGFSLHVQVAPASDDNDATI